MVQMDVREQDIVERVGRNRKRQPVPFEIGPLLKEAAVNEKTKVSRLDVIARTRNLMYCAEELNSQAARLKKLSQMSLSGSGPDVQGNCRPSAGRAGLFTSAAGLSR